MSRSRAVLRCTHPLGLGLENVEEFPQCRSPSLRSSLSASDSALFQGQSGNPTSPNCGAAHQGPKPCSFQLSNPALHRGCGNKRKPCDPLLGNPTDIPALPVRAEATIAVVAHLDEALSLHSAFFTVLFEAHASCNYPDMFVPLQSLLAQSRFFQGLCKATRPWPQVRTAEIGTRVKKKTLPRIRAVRIDDREAFGIPAPRPRLLYRRIAGKLTKRICAGFKLLMPTESS